MKIVFVCMLGLKNGNYWLTVIDMALLSFTLKQPLVKIKFLVQVNMFFREQLIKMPKVAEVNRLSLGIFIYRLVNHQIDQLNNQATHQNSLLKR